MRLRSQTPDFYSDACTEGTLHERLIAIVSKGMKHYRMVEQCSDSFYGSQKRRAWEWGFLTNLYLSYYLTE